MNSLTELKDFLISKEIKIKEFNGWQLKVGKDIWALNNGVFYRNGLPQSLKEKGIFDNYKKVEQNGKIGTRIFATDQSGQTRKWRGISSRNYR